jgi:hypothetical protein
MARQLKRWESPRQEGRNQKGRGGSARQRQYLKQQQTLRKRLKNNDTDPSSKNSSPPQSNSNPNQPNEKSEREANPPLFRFIASATSASLAMWSAILPTNLQ